MDGRKDLNQTPADEREELVAVRSEYERLIEEVNRLRAEIARLTALRDDLISRICPALRAEYEQKIGSLEREILAAKMYLREKQRILELLRAQLNRQETASYQKAEDQAREETRGYEEDLNRKAGEAEEARDRWEKTGWSDYQGSGFYETGDDDPSGPDGGTDGSTSSGSDSETGENASSGGSQDKNGGSSGSGPREDRDRIGQDDGPAGGSDKADGDSAKDAFVRKMRKIYHEIIKRLHPDANPNLTEHEKELFLKAREAFDRGDFDTIMRIYDELEGMKNPEEQYSDTPEDCGKLKALVRKLRALMNQLIREVDSIRGSFPYTMKELLENEELLRERREEMEKQLKDIREADAALEELIRQVRQKMQQ